MQITITDVVSFHNFDKINYSYKKCSYKKYQFKGPTFPVFRVPQGSGVPGPTFQVCLFAIQSYTFPRFSHTHFHILVIHIFHVLVIHIFSRFSHTHFYVSIIHILHILVIHIFHNLVIRIFHILVIHIFSFQSYTSFTFQSYTFLHFGHTHFSQFSYTHFSRFSYTHFLYFFSYTHKIILQQTAPDIQHIKISSLKNHILQKLFKYQTSSSSLFGQFHSVLFF